eukprot:590477-Pleurochrysis_carterae.AAC.1
MLTAPERACEVTWGKVPPGGMRFQVFRRATVPVDAERRASATRVQALPNSRAEARTVCAIVTRRGQRSAPRKSTRDVCLTRVGFADSGIRNVRAPNSKYVTTTTKKSM